VQIPHEVAHAAEVVVDEGPRDEQLHGDGEDGVVGPEGGEGAGEVPCERYVAGGEEACAGAGGGVVGWVWLGGRCVWRGRRVVRLEEEGRHKVVLLVKERGSPLRPPPLCGRPI